VYARSMSSDGARLDAGYRRMGVLHSDPASALLAALAAIVAGPVIGLSIVGIAVEMAGLAAGWPSSFPTVSSGLFPQAGAAGTPLALTVAAGAFLADAYTRRRVFERLAGAGLTLSAAMVSIPICPSLWLVTGIQHPLGWLPSVLVGVAYLVWRARPRSGVQRVLPIAWRAAAGSVVAGGLVAGAALIGSGPHLAAATGPPPTIRALGGGTTGLEVRRSWPASALIRNGRARTLVYRFGITTVGPVPIHVNSVLAESTGPGIRVLGAHAGDGALRYGDDTPVRITLLARACDAGASVSAVRDLVVRYTVLGAIHRTSTFPLPRPLVLTCP
jgi:hypothetical protein